MIEIVLQAQATTLALFSELLFFGLYAGSLGTLAWSSTAVASREAIAANVAARVSEQHEHAHNRFGKPASMIQR